MIREWNAWIQACGAVVVLMVAAAVPSASGQQSASTTQPANPPLRMSLDFPRAAQGATSRPAETQPATTQPSLVDKIKQPVPWFKWGADYRLRWEYLHDAFTLDKHTPDSDWSWQRSRPRVWMTLSPVENFEFNTRFMWESRHFCLPHSRDSWDCEDGMFDIMNVKVKIPNTPATFTLGRQELRFGDGWLVLDGTPLDGSRTLYFDAARLNLDFKEAKTTVDAIALKQWSDTDEWLPPINDRDIHVTEQDETGAILYVSNKSVEKTTIDGYFIYKHDKPVLVNGDKGDIYTVGSRIERDWTKHINTRAEGAFQFGHKNGEHLIAGGLNSRATYFFRDPWKNQLRLHYEFLSGDKPGTQGTNEAFDPLWGRWPQWTEMYIYTYSTETRIAEITNLHRLAFGWQAEPTDKLTLAADYHLLWAAENTYQHRVGFSPTESFRGQLLTGIARYKFNRFLTGHIIGEYLWPGDFYESPRGAPAAYFRMELMWTF